MKPAVSYYIFCVYISMPFYCYETTLMFIFHLVIFFGGVGQASCGFIFQPPCSRLISVTCLGSEISAGTTFGGSSGFTRRQPRPRRRKRLVCIRHTVRHSVRHSVRHFVLRSLRPSVIPGVLPSVAYNCLLLLIFICRQKDRKKYRKKERKKQTKS